ncbi:amylo-alpha-1,6-glucosidase [Tessaracoccus caeni]|uniref:amylo-alpha-1,6-glucosidase n=1 Tax=Tessaracoccus caeni TaxID=3031239 RepID=UPI0023DB6A6A|nr:trehalase family glycosidase [Tessaracoccus caeni]MDF1486804.1 trehalase family glycosidase [Tessaracoccus caeni]
MTPDLGRDLAPRFDLVEVPYTVRRSRLLVRRGPAGLTVYRAAYERGLRDSVVAGDLRLLDDAGAEVPVRRASPLKIGFDGGASLVVTPDDGVHLGGIPAGWRLVADLTLPPAEVALTPDRLVLPDDAVVRVDGTLTEILLPAGGEIGIACAGPLEASFAEARDLVAAELAAWMGRCPDVSPRWREATRLCWWVLGVNTLVLDAPEGLNRAVVPSKIGYVGLWQWDAYFIAIGLRHGDPELAAEQLRIALAYPTAEGQLPDVVHEEGVLASSDDLPRGDLENLRRLGSPSLAHATVPLTKPPLTALAVGRLAEVCGPSVIEESLPTMLVAQHWWYRKSAPGGHPAYLHPYSSGLDDSPIFDHDAIVVSPDLTAYLILSDELLAGWLEQAGRAEEASECRERAAASLSQLLGTWDAERGFFPTLGEHGSPLASETVVSLMPLLASDLPPEQRDALVRAISDPERFGTPHRLPTVAASDADYSTERMWRGPVWVNTTWLVIQGLRRHGLDELADRLSEGILELVEQSGPAEYFRPDTGERARTATVCFGWSAALTIDLAVALS